MLPPSPSHILRDHCAQLNAVAFSVENERLYSGDANGQVIVTSTRTLRPLTSWKAHDDGILGVEEWNEDSVVTHGRDNKLHIWTRVLEPTSLAETAATLTLPLPSLKYSMDVNALNYCRFSLLPISADDSKESQALVALPNLVESSLADIWAIPAVERLYAAIGRMGTETLGPGDGRGESKTGIIMSLHLFGTSHISSSSRMQLRLLVAYENGAVSLFVHADNVERSIEGRGWNKTWTAKAHTESIMSMAVKKDNSAAFTVSADNLICKYLLEDSESVTAQYAVHRTKYPGNGAIAIRDDGRIMAVGGWDGKVRLYSTKSFKALGTLSYHKESCFAVAFANIRGGGVISADQDELDEIDMEGREKWLAAGSKDQRISIWKLIDFDKK